MKQIAYDPGFGNTKAACDGKQSLIPSVVSRPKKIGFSAIGMPVGSRPEIVEVDGTKYAVGNEALSWGSPIGGFDWSSLTSPARLALFYATIAPFLKAGSEEPEDVEVVVGLPVPLLMDEDEFTPVRDQLRAMKGEHVFLVDNFEYQVNITAIKVLAQPVGAFYDFILDEDGNQVQDPRGLYAVIDIGQNTVDIYGLKDGNVSPRHIGGDKGGVRRLLALQESEFSIQEINELLVTGEFELDLQTVFDWTDDLLSSIESTLGNVAIFRGVLICGGGAEIVGKYVADIITSRGGHPVLVEEPVMANVRGIAKRFKS